MNLIEGERLTPCPFCSEPVIVRDRVYTADGYPYPHACPPAPRRVPNEHDFCACGALTWDKPCEDCTPPAQAVPRQIGLARLTDDELAQRITHAMRGPAEAYERLRAEATRRIKLAERAERERKRRALT